MVSKQKAMALGSLLIACSRLDNGVRGGKQKVQKILGEKIFYKKLGKWYYNTPELGKMSAAKLMALTEKIEKA